MTMPSRDEIFMRMALEEAECAARAGEVPVGAVAVRDGVPIAAARNRVEELHSALAHAEIELLRKVGDITGDWRMEKIEFFVTKEPCAMCAGALVNARAGRIVFGMADPRAGGCGSALDIPGFAGMLWHPEVRGGVLADESAELMKAFFKRVRRKDRGSCDGV